MTRAHPTDVAASVRQRLLNLSRERGEDYNLILTRYAIERLLFRLAQTPYAERFVLKGALLFALWTGRLHRPTRDLDLLGYGDSSAEALMGVFQELCAVDVEADGLAFDSQSIQVAELRPDQEYHGQRVRLVAGLGRARISLQVDIGFDDAVVPSAEWVEYPTLLDLPTPRLRAYSKEAVVAEKLHAMVVLGILNSRMKDFYDLWTVARSFPFDGRTLVRAIQSTFARRRTEIPAVVPLALTDGLVQDQGKATQWQAFLRRNHLDADGIDLPTVVEGLRRFLRPPLTAIMQGQAFEQALPAGGPWS